MRYIVEHYLEGRWGYELEDTEFFTGKIGDTVTAQPKDYPGYRYNERISTASGTLIVIEDEGDIVTLKLYYDERTTSRPSGGSSEPSYTVSVEDLVNGTVETDPRRAQEGEEVTITVTPDDGYELDTLTVIDRDGDEVEVTEERDGTFTFEMPDSRVTIEATFVPVAEDIAPEIPTDWSNPYGDVAANAWYYDAVAYVTANGLMNGTSATTFAPDATTTRAMIWTVLARMNGQNVDGGTPWYAMAQSWAMTANVSMAPTLGIPSPVRNWQPCCTVLPAARCQRKSAELFRWQQRVCLGGECHVVGDAERDHQRHRRYADAPGAGHPGHRLPPCSCGSAR